MRSSPEDNADSFENVLVSIGVSLTESDDEQAASLETSASFLLSSANERLEKFNRKNFSGMATLTHIKFRN